MPKFIMLLLFSLIPSLSVAASFDCARAATKSEKLICADPQLSKSDEELATAYANVLHEAADPAAIKKQQREWLTDVRKRCDDTACLRNAYTLRISQLSMDKNEGVQDSSSARISEQAETASRIVLSLGTPQVAAHYHVVTIRPDGNLWAWGANHYHQLGDGSDKTRTAPVRISSDYVRVAVGARHTLGIKSDGSLWGWGSNVLGQLGGESIDGRHPVIMGEGFITAAASDNYSFAIKKDGTLWAWGGLETTGTGELVGVQTDKPTLLGNNYVSVSARGSHYAAVKNDGTLWTWGKNNDGQLGNGNSGYGAGSYEEKPILIGHDYVQVSVGNSYTAAIKKDGTLWTWGLWTALGTGTKESHSTPVMIGSGFAQVVAGFMNTAAIKTDGTLWAWGSNRAGLFGDCTSEIHLSPVKLGEGFTQVAVGQDDYRGQNDFLAALKNDGSVWTWGWQWDSNQSDIPIACRKPVKVDFGNGIGKWDQDAPANTPGLALPSLPSKNIVSLAAGSAHTVMVKADGSLWTWGKNSEGQLGDGKAAPRNIPARVGSGYTQADADHQGTVVLKKDGRLWRWGFDMRLYLSPQQQEKFSLDPNEFYRWTKKQIVPLYAKALDPKEIFKGIVQFKRSGYERGRGLGLKADGTLWDWPYFTDAYKEPVKVGHDIREFAASEFGSFAIRTDGSLWQLQGYPVEPPIQIGSNFLQVVSSKDHAYGIKRDGSLWAWGTNTANQLGDGSNINRADPAKIGTGFVQVATGLFHGLALKGDGSLWAWGQNETGQLGDGSTATRAKPVQIGSGFVKIAAGDYHSVAAKADGTLWAWGANADGQIGDGTNVQRLHPVQIRVVND